MVRCPFWLKVIATLSLPPLRFSSSRPPCMALFAVLHSPPLLSHVAAYLGLDHRSRASLEAAVRLPLREFRQWPALVFCRRAFHYSEPYVRLRARAAARFGAFRAQGPSYHQPDHFGRLCYFAVHPDFGLISAASFPAGHMPFACHLLAPAPPRLSCVSDPRYWRGDVYAFWSMRGFPESRPLEVPSSLVGGYPQPARRGHTGCPGLPPGCALVSLVG